MHDKPTRADFQLELSLDELFLILTALRAYGHNSNYRELRRRLLKHTMSGDVTPGQTQAA